MKATSIRFQFALAAALFAVFMPLNIVIAREALVREHITTLMSELNSRVVAWEDAGRIAHGDANDFTIIHPDGSSIEFTNVAYRANSVSGFVSVYDNHDILTDSFSIYSGTIVDQNRIDFTARSDDGTLTTGTITGGFYRAMAKVNRDGENKLYQVGYSRQGADSLVVAYSMQDLDRTVVTSAILIAVVVIFVAVTCLMFGWWGCTIWTPTKDRYRLA